MALLNTVVKKSESTGLSNDNSSVDEKKVLSNISLGIEELKTQNMENAKFLRGISRKIESELNQIREVEENKSLDGYDDSAVLESIDRVEKSIQEMNSGDVVKEVKKINESVRRINFDNIIEELENINLVLNGINVDVILLEIDKLNRVLKNVNSDSVLDEVAKVNARLDEINISEVINELYRVEDIVSEINENAVLAELQKIKEIINQNNNGNRIEGLDEKYKQIGNNDYADKLLELEDLIKKNDVKIDELAKKVDRVATMPTMIKSIVEKNGEDSLAKIDELMTEINNRESKKNNGMRNIVNINLWVSLLTVAIVIAKILGVI